jgi:Pvc16 N-terminal domain/IPT/TIG domain
MSNFQAIATVTATIAYLLGGVQKDVPAATITTKPPDVVVSQAPYAGLNIFLYQVSMNPGYRNLDQPARGSSGELAKRPRLGLNLHYLITATGDGDDDLQAHQILASAMRILHENPVLTSDTIQNTIVANSEIHGSDLAEQIEHVKVTPLVLNLEEITKLWSSFFQSNYRVSTAYEATVVLLDSTETPKPALPVVAPQISATPFSAPVIQRIDPQVLESSPAASFTITGLNLRGDQGAVSVLIDGAPVPVDQTKITNVKIPVAVPPTVTPGVKSVQVAKGIVPPSGPPALPAFKSNVVPFLLAPKITNAPPISVVHGGNLTLSFTPNVGPGQQVDFLIGDYTISLPQSDAISGFVGSLTLQVPASVPPGTYLLRLRVDGAESLLKPDGSGNFAAPTVTVT